MIKNIIFIDVDGVLNNTKCPNTCTYSFKLQNCPCKPEYGIQEVFKNRFINLIKTCPENTQFVLISSWRLQTRLLNTFRQTFKEVDNKYWGCLDFSWDEVHRETSIAQWLTKNIETWTDYFLGGELWYPTDDKCNYVVLDDRKYTLIDKHNPNVKGLKIDVVSNIGLSEEDCAAAKFFLESNIS